MALFIPSHNGSLTKTTQVELPEIRNPSSPTDVKKATERFLATCSEKLKLSQKARFMFRFVES